MWVWARTCAGPLDRRSVCAKMPLSTDAEDTKAVAQVSGGPQFAGSQPACDAVRSYCNGVGCREDGERVGMTTGLATRSRHAPHAREWRHVLLPPKPSDNYRRALSIPDTTSVTHVICAPSCSAPVTLYHIYICAHSAPVKLANINHISLSAP